MILGVPRIENPKEFMLQAKLRKARKENERLEVISRDEARKRRDEEAAKSITEKRQRAEDKVKKAAAQLKADAQAEQDRRQHIIDKQAEKIANDLYK